MCKNLHNSHTSKEREGKLIRHCQNYYLIMYNIVYLLNSMFSFASVEALFPAYTVDDTLISFIAEYPDGLHDLTTPKWSITSSLFVDSRWIFLGDAFGIRLTVYSKRGSRTM